MKKDQKKDQNFFVKFLEFILSRFKSGENENESLVKFGLDNQETPMEHDADWKPLTAEDYNTILDAADNTNDAIKEYYTKTDDRSVDEWGSDKFRDLAGEVDPSLSDDHQKDIEIEDGLNEIVNDESKGYAAVMAGRELTDEELKDAEKED